jgi:hypothetical protein
MSAVGEVRQAILAGAGIAQAAGIPAAIPLPETGC